MKYDISFIHTGQVHIEKFARLVTELSPSLTVNHVVDESLLEHAQQFGSDQWLHSQLKSHLERLSLHSKVIVVTCSSIGELAEEIAELNGCIIQRVDQAMADFAVNNGHNILVLAASESTLVPTQALLESSKSRLDSNAHINLHHIEHAWDCFLDGRINEYYAHISNSILANEHQYDLIVLAQASMSEAVNQINVSIPVVSSPLLGVKRAIASLS